MLQDPFSNFLTKKFSERRLRNPSYSIRAFAKSLAVDQSSLTKAIKGQHRFSFLTLSNLIDRLDDGSQEVREVRRDVTYRYGEYASLAEDSIEMIAEWHHWAILELFKIRSFAQTAEDTADRLTISPATAKDALERLVRLGFLSGKEGNYELLIPNSFWSTTEKTSVARKRLQRSWLEKSVVALAEVPFEEREHGSMTFAMDSSRIEEFKVKLRELQTSFASSAQKTGEFDSVYQLTLSLFPLTQKVVR